MDDSKRKTILEAANTRLSKAPPFQAKSKVPGKDGNSRQNDDKSRNGRGSARVITGEEEGLYGWTAMNYGRGKGEPVVGIVEMGGASMQIAYKDRSGQTKARTPVCVLSGNHMVYSRTWDGLGADIMGKEMLNLAILEQTGDRVRVGDEAGNDDGVFRQLAYPCFPRDQPRTMTAEPVLNGNGSTSQSTRKYKFMGNGDFPTCLVYARKLLGKVDNLHIPKYLDVKSHTERFFGISNFWYTYTFFANWGSYSIHDAYNRPAFEEAVEKYCTNDWEDIPWSSRNIKYRKDKFIGSRCFNAAWMLTILHDHPLGFGLEMTQYDNWKRRFLFPSTPLLADRASWTVGAAALIARNPHQRLEFCDARTLANSSIYEKPYPLIQSTPDYLIQPTSPISNSSRHPCHSLSNLVFYALAVLGLVTLIHRCFCKSSMPAVQDQIIIVPENTPTRVDRIRAFFRPRNIMISGPDDAAFFPKDVKNSSLA